MQFKLTINCNGAAFYREGQNEGDEPLFDYLGVEIQSLLARSATVISSHGVSAARGISTLFDSNGNPSCYFALADEDADKFRKLEAVESVLRDRFGIEDLDGADLLALLAATED